MKKITFLLLILCATTFFGQDQLTSSLSESFDGTSWVPVNRTEFIYDNSNNLTEEAELSWNSGTSQWIKTVVSTYTYNANNNSIIELYQRFNGTNVDQQNRTTNTYNSEGELTQFLDEDYLNSNWVNTYKVALEYANGSIASGISYEWNEAAWVIGEASTQVEINYNLNGTVSSVVTDIRVGSSWLTTYRSVYSYDANNRVTLKNDEFFDGSTWSVENKLEYTYDANGNVVTEKEFYKDNGVFVVDYEDINTFDTSQSMADFAHPFKDKNGIDYLFSVNGIINKILTTTYSESRITYNYGEATASIPAFNLANVQVHPNPATDILNISIQNGSIFKINIYNLLGKKIFTSTENTINVENLAKGVYLLKIQSENGGVITKKLIKN